jgi:HTH-type transcriptional regulator/antitoxin HigA
MNKHPQNQYTPDFVSPPGETLLDTLETLGMTQAELANRTGRPKKTINEIVQGKAAITSETALQLELVLGVPATFWLRREQQYREWLARQEEENRLRNQTGWLREIPLQQMISFGWVKGFEDPVRQLREVLNYFGVASPDQWRTLYEGAVAFRRSMAFQANPTATAAWLRQGELKAQKIECAPYDPEKFRQALSRVRSLTVQPPQVFEPELRKECARAGVAVVLIRELPGTHVCGATRWLTPDKALIQLSLRYKTDDQLWHSFFHESGHVLLHGKREVFLETANGTGVQEGEVQRREEEANRFAAHTLIPPVQFQYFTTHFDYRSMAAIQAYAGEIGIAPGILVGQLQHEGLIPYQNCNRLKRRFQWAAEAEKD